MSSLGGERSSTRARRFLNWAGFVRQRFDTILVGSLFIGAFPVLVDEKDVGLLVLGTLELFPGAWTFRLPFVATAETVQADVVDGLAQSFIIVLEGLVKVESHALGSRSL